MWKRILKRFLRGWLCAFLGLNIMLPQDWGDIKPYLIKFGVAIVIAFFLAADKFARDYAGNGK